MMDDRDGWRDDVGVMEEGRMMEEKTYSATYSPFSLLLIKSLFFLFLLPFFSLIFLSKKFFLVYESRLKRI